MTKKKSRHNRMREALWEENYQLLLQFSEREGHVDVPRYHLEDGVRLGTWVAHQRQFYRKNKLPKHRIERLERLPGWHWSIRPVNKWIKGKYYADRYEALWEKGYQLLLQFSEREGHMGVPSYYIEDGYRLGKWVARQRKAYRLGKLPKHRLKRLESLPGWHRS